MGMAPMPWARSLAQGLWLGVAIVLPGLSGGTAALVLGIYERLVHDLGRFRWQPYHLPLAVGAGVGLVAGARLLDGVLAVAPDLLSAFLLGAVLASAWLAFQRFPEPPASAVGAWLLGVGLALAVARHPLAPQAAGGAGLSLPLAFLAGGLAGTAMMLPGMSGATLLILLGVYDDMLAAVNGLAVPVLASFAAGVVLGMVNVARLVSALLLRAPELTGLFLAGLLLGSARAVVPVRVGWAAVPFVLAGAVTVLAARGREAGGA